MAAQLQTADFCSMYSLDGKQFFVHNDDASSLCYLNAGRCIWTNFCDVISIRRVGFSVQNNFNLLMKWTFWFCWKLLFIDGLVSPLKNLCIFAIQNCF